MPPTFFKHSVSKHFLQNAQDANVKVDDWHSLRRHVGQESIQRCVFFLHTALSFEYIC